MRRCFRGRGASFLLNVFFLFNSFLFILLKKYYKLILFRLYDFFLDLPTALVPQWAGTVLRETEFFFWRHKLDFRQKWNDGKLFCFILFFFILFTYFIICLILLLKLY